MKGKQMKKEKKEQFIVNYLAYVNETCISNLYMLFRKTPWSFTEVDAYTLKDEIERTDQQLGI